MGFRPTGTEQLVACQNHRRPDELAYTVFRGSDALRDGLLSSKALRGPGWTRLRYDMFADSRLEHDHELACRAAALILPESAVIAGRSAAFLLGVDHAASFTDDGARDFPRLLPGRGTH